jgi:hypothetical protein
MTDPFKKQRYSSPNMHRSSSSHMANTLSTIEENTFNKYTTNTFNSLNIADVETKSSFYDRNLNGDDKRQQVSLNQPASDQALFVQAHLESNKELIAQLKSNIELLFKASKYVFFCYWF